MRLRIKNEMGEVEITLQTRISTQAVIRHKGQIIGAGDAILNPHDQFNELEGYKIALGRAMETFDPLIGSATRRTLTTNLYLKLLQKLLKVRLRDLYRRFNSPSAVDLFLGGKL